METNKCLLFIKVIIGKSGPMVMKRETYWFFFISYGTANLQFPDKKIYLKEFFNSQNLRKTTKLFVTKFLKL
jgi:hypothetical protein